MKTSTLSVILCFLAGIFVNAVSIDKRQSRGSLQQVTGWTPNPTNVGMYVYIPNNLASSPGLILAIHYCQGSAQAYYTGSPYAQLAEEYGFIVIYPNSPHSGSCWDVSSEATLTHNGGGDSNSIANMVGYAVSTWGVNSAKVYVTGSSSGAMMTNVLSATYPELFKAASVYSGVPAGCFVSSTNQVDAWNSTCALGDQIDTPAQWGNVVRAMYAGYSGARPKMLIWHGTADTTLYPQNYFETMKQWTNVFGYNYNARSQRRGCLRPRCRTHGAYPWHSRHGVVWLCMMNKEYHSWAKQERSLLQLVAVWSPATAVCHCIIRTAPLPESTSEQL